MNTIVIEHVTVRIEEEAPADSPQEFVTDDPAFGIWRDRQNVGWRFR